MSGKRYAVLDKDGKCINHILIADPLPKGYWPGYGAYLCPLEEVQIGKGAGLDLIDFKFEKSGVPQIGDTVNIETGEITRFVPELKQDVDAEGEPITVASAPEQKFIKDEEPKEEGEIIIKDGK